jgi:membrane protein
VSQRAQGIVAGAKLRLERARARYAAVDIAVRTFRRYSEDDGGTLAAALTYFTFLSVFPLLIFAVAALGYLTFGNLELRARILDAGIAAVPLLNDILNREVLDGIIEARNRLALVGLALALYSGSGAVVALEHALNRIAHITQEPNFAAKRLRSLRWLAILGIGAVLSAALTAAAGFTERMFESLGAIATGPVSLFFYLGAIGVSVGIFATAFKFLPARSSGWREVLPGALLAAGAFELLKVAGEAYLDRGSGGRSATFGAFATAAGFLIASYLISQITLLAAEVNAVLAERRLTRQSGPIERRGGSE